MTMTEFIEAIGRVADRITVPPINVIAGFGDDSVDVDDLKDQEKQRSMPLA